MKKVEVTYEVTRRISLLFDVTEEEYEEIQNGSLPDRVTDELEYGIDTGDSDREDDWAATDAETGVLLQDWR